MKLLNFLFKIAVAVVLYLALSNFLDGFTLAEVIDLFKQKEVTLQPEKSEQMPQTGDLNLQTELAKQSIELAKQIALFELERGFKQAIEIRLQKFDKNSAPDAPNTVSNNSAPDAVHYSFDTVFVYTDDNKQFNEYKNQILKYNGKLKVLKK